MLTTVTVQGSVVAGRLSKPLFIALLALSPVAGIDSMTGSGAGLSGYLCSKESCVGESLKADI